MAKIVLQPGLNPVQTGVDYASLSLTDRLPFLLFGKHLEQIAASAHFSVCVLSKNGLPVCLGGRILVALYRFLFASATKN